MPEHPKAALFDVTQIESKLKRHLSGEVRFDAGSRALYTSDASNYRQVPIGVVIPKTVDDVIATVATAREFGAPILSRGGGTSIPGQCCNEAIVMDFTKYLHHVIEIDPQRKLARVEPGLVLDDLRDAAKQYGLTFGPDPATHKWCTLGGMIGNDSCGVHSIMAGRTADNLHDLNVLLYDGTVLRVGKGHLSDPSNQSARVSAIYESLQKLANTYGDEIRKKFPQIPRRVSGYNIDQLLPENEFQVARALCGSEGTLMTILEATVNLIPNPEKRVLLVAGYDDIATAGDNVETLLAYKKESGARLVGLEGMDRTFIADMKKKHLHEKQLGHMPEGTGWLIAEFGADAAEDAKSVAERALKDLRSNGRVVDSRIYDGEQEQKDIWTVRDSGLGATARIPGQKDNWEGWEDSAVPPEKVGNYLRDFRKLMSRYNYIGSVYGHIGDGCIHTRLDWEPKNKQGIEKWVKFTHEAADLVISYGGSLSGEHGDGQARGELLPKMFGPKIMQAFEEFKEIWDPDWKMNPGKLIRPYKIDQNLRYGADYNPPMLPTFFQFPDDKGSFARATERCVGAAVCRREHDGVMCPSYRATREEEHVTRGRTHLLWEMLHGDVITDGWKSDAVKDALDLCLACKGCKSDCPVRVDMATYKSEFLAHYYEGKIRPRAAYAMGMIYRAARIASIAPSLVNWLTHSPLTRGVAKAIAGIHPNREIPKFAKETFKDWFFRKPKSDTRNPTPDTRAVILWADTFNNYFRAETAKAAVSVLEAAGFKVKVYQKTMCCGRPLYDWGMIKQAKKQLEEILQVVDKDISAGMPMVVLEPSCASVFRDELRNLMPDREDAKRLMDNTYLLSEFLEKFAPNSLSYKAMRNSATGGPRSKHALVQFHCHHHAVLDKDAETSVLKKSGTDAEILDAGCCGMAGAFGFEKEKYELSMQIGEKKLLPKIRATSEDHLIIADGFSCREQIEQATGRKTYHLAEVLAKSPRELLP
ncbi:MAG TPA: FAD-linked oxidase C-terminal domain-containing protein [Candidatus Kapabacteria bacterium]|nr:FAD-linked oxidase C-terminal domain-containing protein [Candidatus Kapabacteria bacterium]